MNRTRLFHTTLLSTLAVLIAVAPMEAAYAVPTPSPSSPNAVGQALEIAPPIINVSGDPGQKIDTKISLRDVSTSSLRVTSEINDFTANGEDGTPKILLDQKERTPYSIADWISPLPALTLKAKEVKELPVSIQIPKDASPGGYYGVIRFSAAPPDMKESGVALSASLGTLVFLRVNGEAKESMTIESFFVTSDGEKKEGVFEGIPFTFVERIKNTGNIYEQPSGRILITDMFGNPAANVNVNLEQRNILPGTTRKFTQEFNKDALGNRFLFGLYNAKMTLTYGNKQTLSSSLSFWVIPYKLIIGIIIALIALVIGARVMLRRYTDRAVGKSRGTSRRR